MSLGVEVNKRTWSRISLENIKLKDQQPLDCWPLCQVRHVEPNFLWHSDLGASRGPTNEVERYRPLELRSILEFDCGTARPYAPLTTAEGLVQNRSQSRRNTFRHEAGKKVTIEIQDDLATATINLGLIVHDTGRCRSPNVTEVFGL
jgi:hypothetical protein